MKKFNIKWVSACLLASSFALTSCSDDDNATSVVQSFEEITIDASRITPITVTEGGDFTFKFPLSQSQIIDVHVDVANGASSTAEAFTDFDPISDNILVPSRGEANVSFSVLPDYHVEGDETIYLSISGDDSDIVGVSNSAEVLAVTITDMTYNVKPGIILEWGGSFPFGSGRLGWCGNVDIDLFIVATGSADPYADVTGFAGAGSACPEVVFVDDIADGTYDLYAELYEGVSGNGISTAIPLKLSVFESGVEEFQFSVFAGAASPWTGNTADGANVFIGRITVAGDKITLFNASGTNLGTVGD